ncbi:TlpA family protein disulfide reductase [Dokdonia sp. Hel_I_53]|uniref:TlpA family protein disulfide reductase n=1 Tax=Dokdonia sp. Hel_I_53 TaxID=1566287 RepID=UPI0016484C0A|nr:TlpA disulfide reductase family protein [Dokdonia sp. Hel_I_53]
MFSPSAISQSRQINIEPFSYKLQTLDGGQRDILVGDGSVVFLSYWATWCPPCIAELPSIEKLYEDYNNKVTFLLITDEDPKIVKKFLDKKGYSLPVYMPLIKTPPILFERTIPTNYVIDQNGKIIIKEQGASNWNSEQVREVFDNLLVTD